MKRRSKKKVLTGLGALTTSWIKIKSYHKETGLSLSKGMARLGSPPPFFFSSSSFSVLWVREESLRNSVPLSTI